MKSFSFLAKLLAKLDFKEGLISFSKKYEDDICSWAWKTYSWYLYFLYYYT